MSAVVFHDNLISGVELVHEFLFVDGGKLEVTNFVVQYRGQAYLRSVGNTISMTDLIIDIDITAVVFGEIDISLLFVHDRSAAAVYVSESTEVIPGGIGWSLVVERRHYSFFDGGRSMCGTNRCERFVTDKAAQIRC